MHFRVYLQGIINEGKQQGKKETMLAAYNIVLPNGDYKGEIKIGLKFISNVSILIIIFNHQSSRRSPYIFYESQEEEYLQRDGEKAGDDPGKKTRSTYELLAFFFGQWFGCSSHPRFSLFKAKKNQMRERSKEI